MLELVVVLGIITLIASLSVSSFVNLNRDQTVDKAALLAVSVLDEARSLTLASKNSSQYGVHFDDVNAQIILFTGSVYSAGASSNQINALDAAVQISSINLAGLGKDVVFNRLTGGTAQTGTVTISSRTDNTSKTVTVYGTGEAESR